MGYQDLNNAISVDVKTFQPFVCLTLLVSILLRLKELMFKAIIISFVFNLSSMFNPGLS